MTAADPPVRRRETILFQGEWVTVVQVETACGNTCERWEIVRRPRHRGGVVILAELMPSRRIVLIKQRRPALEATILTLPAGLIDDDPARSAVRELKEETGYSGFVRRISPPMRGAAGFLDETAYFVEMTIDEAAPKNRHPRQELEPEEQIEVLTPRYADIPALLDECLREGISVSSSVWTLFAVAPRLWDVEPR